VGEDEVKDQVHQLRWVRQVHSVGEKP
jgi:hypothetical protein